MLYPSTHVVLLVFGGQRLDAFGWTVLPKSASYFDLLKKETTSLKVVRIYVSIPLQLKTAVKLAYWCL
jgi:hypothetical protein